MEGKVYEKPLSHLYDATKKKKDKYYSTCKVIGFE